MSTAGSFEHSSEEDVVDFCCRKSELRVVALAALFGLAVVVK